MEVKKIGATVVLVAIIVAALLFIAQKLGFGTSKPPQWVVNEPTEKIDKDTLDLKTLTFGEWHDLGHADGIYKNPETGKYSMVSAVTCPRCTEKIPAPPMPAGGAPDDGAPYICPKCGQETGMTQPR